MMRSIGLAGLATAFILGATTAGVGQVIPPNHGLSGDTSLTYHWVRTNTQPGDCDCFGLNGSGISASWNVVSHLAVVGEVSGEYTGKGPSTANSLTLVTYLAGARYTLPQSWLDGPHGPQPFVQALFGVGHAGGGIAGAGDGSVAFATRIGGGLDVPLSPHFAIRIVQVDYYLTGFDNAGDNHQDNLLLGTGVVYRWFSGK